MEGVRIAEFPEKIQKVKEQLFDVPDIDQVKVIHEIIDDTPYKTKNYTKYLHDEYYIVHNKRAVIESSVKKYKLKTNKHLFQQENLVHIIENRHSLRDYENQSISFETFSNILHYSFGVKYFGLGAYNQRKYPFKYTNSQGGLNYLDLYIVVNRVEGIEKGLYYYDFINDEICLLDYGNMRLIMNEINYQNEFTVYSNFICFVVADLERVVLKYYKRSYRFSHVDTGILVAYLQLLAEYHGLGSCAVAGFLEHKLDNLLNLSSNDYPIISISFGYKPEEI